MTAEFPGVSYRKVVRRHFPLGSPKRRIIHESKRVTASNNAGNGVHGSFGVNSAFLIQQVVDRLAVHEDNEVTRPHFE